MSRPLRLNHWRYLRDLVRAESKSQRHPRSAPDGLLPVLESVVECEERSIVAADREADYATFEPKTLPHGARLWGSGELTVLLLVTFAVGFVCGRFV